MMNLTDFDKALLNKIQTKLPIVSHPFALIAKELGVEEETVLKRLQELKDEGFIRKIGAFFNSEELGYVGTLVAVKVQPDFVRQVAEKINTYDGVTHNYERYDEKATDLVGQYNLWFTLIVDNETLRTKVLDEISALPGVEQLVNLPAIQKYKVSVRFSL
jgi:DNA-binding Lrp family transcriptional regulator